MLLFLLPRLLRLLVLLLVIGFVAATARLIIWPPSAHPARADAVVVLSGSRGERLDRALELMRTGVADVLVISSSGNERLEPRSSRLCRTGRGSGFTVLCFHPLPDSTRGEAKTIARLATRNRWHSIVVVTSRYHVTRAKLLVERCFDGDVDTVAATYDLSSLPVAVASEWTKLIHALTSQRRC
jgi:uncharacterized SAM-binding protein YcdF (DUF218 family)